ncbi:uncharacterized protein LOC114246831 isoform X2 [Bombyx mandarina]|uniref:Uncharacterized protein n=2 Tax=Bombyx TaxID=7090 RepID=A0A8R2G787_BOMMO|nr:uncharacterized protein LOC105841360 isoform X2 [Bombyx mori]XP_028035342.1 uncharacterized protein LOC114246831 isoform X2 [Bombyx mandarina]
MQASPPPWSPWWRSQAQLPRDYWHKPRLGIYTLSRDLPLRHVMRLEGVGPIIPTPATSNWMLRYRPLDSEPWRLPIPIPSDLEQFRVETVTGRAPRTHSPSSEWWGGGGAAGAGGGGGAALGWAAGVVLLALLVLLVRAMEKCLDKRLFKMQTDRQESDEWPAPTVRATNNQECRPADVAAAGPNGEAYIGAGATSDLPPPYSECANSTTTVGPKPGEDPPPPYSTCYFSNNPKDEPSVHFINIQNRSDTNRSDVQSGPATDINTAAETVRVEIENEIPRDRTIVV